MIFGKFYQLDLKLNEKRYYRYNWVKKAGLPLAPLLVKKNVIGFDKDRERINQLKRGIDRNNEFKRIKNQKQKYKFTCKSNLLSECNIYIVTNLHP